MGGYLLRTQADDEDIVIEISNKLVRDGISKKEFGEKLRPLKAQAAMHEQACIIRRMSEHGMSTAEIANLLDISESTIKIVLNMGDELEYDYAYSGILKPLSLAI